MEETSAGSNTKIDIHTALFPPAEPGSDSSRHGYNAWMEDTLSKPA